MHRASLLLVALLLAAVPVTADDPDPPVFKSASIAPGPYAPGELVPVEISWEDASGVASIWGSVQGPNGLGSPWVECPETEERRVVSLTCQIHLPERAPAGAYRLAWTGAQDVIGHYAHAEVDVPFAVESPFHDTEAPRLTGLEQQVVEIDMQAAMMQWGQVRVPDAFMVSAEDEHKVLGGSLGFIGPNGNRGLHVQCDAWEGQQSPCTVYADPEIPAGDYVLESLFLTDEIGYHRHYAYTPWGDDLAAFAPEPPVLQVTSEHVDDQPPELVGLTFPGKLHRGQPFELWINVTDETVVEYAQVRFQTTRGNAGYDVWHLAQCEGEPASERHMRCTGRFPENFPLGLAIVDWVAVEDEGRNHGWYRPVTWGGWGQTFEDNDEFDVGTVLVPRPIEGVLEAIDAVVNEVMPGEAATIVYRTKDAVDDVTLKLEDAGDGSVVEVACREVVVTPLGEECTFIVPADEAGVLSLVEATVHTAQGNSSSVYAPGEVPLVAVTKEIPQRPSLSLATGGGPLNDVGLEWMASFQEAGVQEETKERSDQPEEAEAPKAVPETPSPDTSTHEPPPSLRPAKDVTGAIRDSEASRPAPVLPETLPEQGAEAVSTPGVAPLLPLLLALRRRR